MLTTPQKFQKSFNILVWNFPRQTFPVERAATQPLAID